MSEPAKTPSPFDLLVEQIRAVVREEIKAALGNGKLHTVEKDWMKAAELADLKVGDKVFVQIKKDKKTGDMIAKSVVTGVASEALP